MSYKARLSTVFLSTLFFIFCAVFLALYQNGQLTIFGYQQTHLGSEIIETLSDWQKGLGDEKIDLTLPGKLKLKEVGQGVYISQPIGKEDLIYFESFVPIEKVILPLENPSFEEGEGDKPKGWGQKVGDMNFLDKLGIRSQEKAKEGKWSAKILDEEKDKAVGLSSQPFSVNPSLHYLISAYVYVLEKTSFEGAFELSLKFLDKDGHYLSSLDTEIKEKTKGFSQVNLSAVPPKEATSAYLIVSSSLKNKGLAYFDDLEVSLKDVKPNITYQFAGDADNFTTFSPPLRTKSPIPLKDQVPPGSKYVKVKITLASSDPDLSPALDGFVVNYRAEGKEEKVEPASMKKTIKLVSSGAVLGFNLTIALLISGGIGYYLLRRPKE